MISQDWIVELEQMIDKHGLHRVLDALSEICSEKEQHVRSNWQDSALARQWRKYALQFDKMAINVPSELR